MSLKSSLANLRLSYPYIKWIKKTKARVNSGRRGFLLIIKKRVFIISIGLLIALLSIPIGLQ